MNNVITKRNFDVSVELLYRAWTEPNHLKNWWGPDGFTNTFFEFDLTEGGYWRFTMHSPDGKDYENESRFVTIIKNKKIIFNHISPPKFRTEVNFKAIAENSSSLHWEMIFDEEKVYIALKNFITEKNEENLNRLERELEKIKPT